MVELLFLATLRRGMRDGLLTLPSLGQSAGVYNENSMLRYICLPIYHNTDCRICQDPKLEHLYLVELPQSSARHPTVTIVTTLEVFRTTNRITLNCSAL